QALQFAFRDQLPDQAVDGLESAGILDPQSGQSIDVEKAPVVDVAGSQSPMPEPVVLALEQMMQRQDLRRAIRSGPIGVEPARDDLGASGEASQFRLERGRFIAIGMSQSPLARGEVENAFSCRAAFSPGFSDDRAQDFAVALGCDRQAMFEVPGRKTSLIPI